MSTKKKPPPEPGTVIQNCHFQAVAPQTNEHTRAAVVALSEAAQANAAAIAEIARALKGGDATFGTGITITGT